MNDLLTLISSIATAIGVLVAAIGVFLAAWQLLLAHRQSLIAHSQSITAFEDSFAREYRELAATLPTKALLGDKLSEEEHAKHFDEFYHYFDLSNEQAFLHLTGRVTPATWKFWHDGMDANFHRPAFERAWKEIAARAKNDFAELRQFFPPDSEPPTSK